MNARTVEVREALKRERELHRYAARLAAKLAAHPHYGAWMVAMSRARRHPCGGRFARPQPADCKAKFEGRKVWE